MLEENKEKLAKLDAKIEKGKKNPKKKIIICLVVLGILMIGAAIAYYFLFMNEEPKKEKKKEEVKKLTIVDEDSNQRPLALMIDNNVGNDAHAGLQESIINYEIIVEGGLTRIMAVFKDKDVELIGPVRSSRHYFLDYALESDAIYAHYGWSTYAENDIKSLGVNNINGLYDNSAYWRDNTLSSPHNVFTSTETLYKYASENKNYDITTSKKNWWLLNYTPDEVNFPEGKTDEKTGEVIEEDERIIANSISIPYSNSQSRSYTYDSERKVYLRYMNGTAHTDKTTKEILNFKNLIIEKVKNYDLDSEGRQDLNTTGTGEGYYITNGYAMEIAWKKDTRNGKTKYTYLDGTEIEVNDGNTFVQIIPDTSYVTFE